MHVRPADNSNDGRMVGPNGAVQCACFVNTAPRDFVFAETVDARDFVESPVVGDGECIVWGALVSALLYSYRGPVMWRAGA